MKALILAAGRGTRMWPLSVARPKHVIPIWNRATVAWLIDQLPEVVDDLVVVLPEGKYAQPARDLLKQLSTAQRNIRWVSQTADYPSGTAGAVLAGMSAWEDVPEQELVLILNGDDLYAASDLDRLVSAHLPAVLAQPVPDPQNWGVVEANDQNMLVAMVEKPESPRSNLANTGAYYLPAGIVKILSTMNLSARGELELPAGVSQLAQEQQIKVFQVKHYWQSLNYPWQLLSALKLLADQVDYQVTGEVEPGAVIKGRLKLGAGSVIRSGCYLTGDVVIGQNCQIGPNARLRGPVAIGDGTVVGPSVDLKNAVIGSECFVSHLAVLSDGILDDQVNFAAGCIATNFRHDQKNVQVMVKQKLVDTKLQKFSTVIGKAAKLGAGTIIYPGRLLGAEVTTLPGQVVRHNLTASQGTEG